MSRFLDILNSVKPVCEPRPLTNLQLAEAVKVMKAAPAVKMDGGYLIHPGVARDLCRLSSRFDRQDAKQRRRYQKQKRKQ